MKTNWITDSTSYIECADAGCHFPLRAQDPPEIQRSATVKDAEDHVLDTGHSVMVFTESQTRLSPLHGGQNA